MCFGGFHLDVLGQLTDCFVRRLKRILIKLVYVTKSTSMLQSVDSRDTICDLAGVGFCVCVFWFDLDVLGHLADCFVRRLKRIRIKLVNVQKSISMLKSIDSRI